VVPFDDEMAGAAFDAFRLFGKGQEHPAQLNIVDCAAYALAKVRSKSLLFKCDEFAPHGYSVRARLIVESSQVSRA
jgi:ribonuclease VapC